ncbi:30S ribosomal protein S16-2 [Chlorella vulgaris]
MVVRLRLARFGRKNFPFYRIFAADARCPRDGRHLEQLGHFDPIPGMQQRHQSMQSATQMLALLTMRILRVFCAGKDGNKSLGLNIERIQYWLSVGAQPSQTVARLLGQAGVIPKPPQGLRQGQVKNPDKYAKK